MYNKRILLIANNCLSEQNSNGRTMLNLVRDLPKENIAQIYTSGEIADSQYCGASLRITNREVIRSYFSSPNFNIPCIEKLTDNGGQQDIKGKKTALTMLLRDLVWDNSIRLKKNIISWAKEQNASCVILQLGDSSLLITIANYITQSLHLPLITYNTEDYYFKNYDFMKYKLKSNLIYHVFHHRFCSKFNKMMKQKPTCIYNCDGLRELYDNRFHTHSIIKFCGTSCEKVEKIKEDGMILYSGNLGVGRHQSLIEIGKVLKKIDSSLFIDVYGQATGEVKEVLNHADGIRYNGVVSYQENCENIKKSRLLVQVESFDAFFKVDTKYAFSTKIADYCASGIPIFAYCPSESESYRYLSDNNAAIMADCQDDLLDSLRSALFNPQKRSAVVNSAIRLAKRNHTMEDNQIDISEIMKRITGE